MKMPVPMVAPTPNMESWKSPMVRASSLLSESAPVSGGHLRDRLLAEQLLCQ